MNQTVQFVAMLLDLKFRVIDHGGRNVVIAGRRFPASVLRKATHLRYLQRIEYRKVMKKVGVTR